MIKLNKIEVQNFKSLVNTQVEALGDVNLFFGFNNSGKSNIFKFLKILFERKRKGTKIKYESSESIKTITDTLVETTNFWSGYIWSEPFLFTKNNRDNAITFTVELIIRNNLMPQEEQLKAENFLSKTNETKLVLVGEITARDTETSYLQIQKALLNGKIFYKYEDQIDEFFPTKGSKIDKQVGADILLILNDLVLLIDSDRNLTIEKVKDGVATFDVKNFKNALYELYINAEKNESFNLLNRFLGNFEFSEDGRGRLGSNLNSFPFNHANDIGFTKFDSEIEIMLKNNEGKLPLKNFGTGIQQFLYLLTIIHMSKSRIVIIEEIELNLSPLYQKELLLFIKSLMPHSFDQLLFSSHSPFFTKKDAILIDYIHHIVIDYLVEGTTVECHDREWVMNGYDEVAGESVISRFYS